MTIHNRLVALGVLSVALATPQLVLAQSKAPQMNTARARENERRGSCQSNLKRLGMALTQYAADHDEKRPTARRWMEEIRPYVVNMCGRYESIDLVFNCPALNRGKIYGYAYNSNLSGQIDRQIARRDQIVSIYETTILKRSAFGKGANRAYRHLGGANYAYADGHVKWIAKTSMSPMFRLKP